MTTDEILARIHGIESVELLLCKHKIYGNIERTWWCKLEYKQPGLEMKFEGHGPTYDQALREAYGRLTQVAEFGVGRGWDVPALEHKADEAEVMKNILDDDAIPF